MAVLSGKKILVVDGDSQILTNTKSILKGAGADVYTASEPSRALWYVDGVRFDAVITDTKLPGMTGIQMIDCLRLKTNGKKTPVVVVAESIDADSVQQLARQGVSHSLIKPVATDQLIAKITGLFRKKVKPDSKQSSYDPRIVKCFVIGVGEMLSDYIMETPKVGLPEAKKEQRPADYSSAVMAFSGQGSFGSMSISFEKDFLPVLAEKVFMGATVDLNEEMMKDLTGEMCNQVLGKVKQRFQKLGLDMQIGLPEMFIGYGHEITHLSSNPVVAIPISVSGYTCTVEFSMEEGVADIGQSSLSKDSGDADIGLWD